jgi:hypothetical protein
MSICKKYIESISQSIIPFIVKKGGWVEVKTEGWAILYLTPIAYNDPDMARASGLF